MRYSSSTFYAQVYEDWSKQYKISTNDQLIFKQIDNDQFCLVDKSLYKYNSINDYSTSNLDDNKFLIHDAKQLIMINKDEIIKYNNKTDLNDSMINYQYKLKRLIYFDVIQQKLYQAGYVLCSAHLPITQIISYITSQCMHCIQKIYTT